MSKTVTMEDQEWTQLVAIIANATGFQTVSKLFNQLAAQEPQQTPWQPGDDPGQLAREVPSSMRGDGFDPDPPPRRAPRA